MSTASDDLLAQLLDGRARVHDSHGLYVEDARGECFAVQESRHASPGTVGWTTLTYETCVAVTERGYLSPYTLPAACPSPVLGNGFCRYHGGEGEPGQVHRVGVWTSSVQFLRFAAWCGQQRRESQQIVNQACADTRARLFPGKVYVAALGTSAPAGRFPTDEGWTLVGTVQP